MISLLLPPVLTLRNKMRYFLSCCCYDGVVQLLLPPVGVVLGVLFTSKIRYYLSCICYGGVAVIGRREITMVALWLLSVLVNVQ